MVSMVEKKSENHKQACLFILESSWVLTQQQGRIISDIMDVFFGKCSTSKLYNFSENGSMAYFSAIRLLGSQE